MYKPYMYENERISYPKVGDIILYSVNRGDNVYRISKTFNSDPKWIQMMNNLDENMLIHPQQQLYIPIIYQTIQPYMQPNLRQSYDLYF